MGGWKNFNECKNIARQLVLAILSISVVAEDCNKKMYCEGSEFSRNCPDLCNGFPVGVKCSDYTDDDSKDKVCNVKFIQGCCPVLCKGFLNSKKNDQGKRLYYIFFVSIWYFWIGEKYA